MCEDAILIQFIQYNNTQKNILLLQLELFFVFDRKLCIICIEFINLNSIFLIYLH